MLLFLCQSCPLLMQCCLMTWRAQESSSDFLAFLPCAQRFLQILFYVLRMVRIFGEIVKLCHTMMVFVHPIMLLTLCQLTYLAVTFSFSYFLVAITYPAFCVPRFLTVACHQLETDLMFFMKTSVFYYKQNICLWDMMIYKNPVIFINHRMLFLFTFNTVSQLFLELGW